MPIDFEQLEREWIHRIRGRISQRALSKRLGYESNVVYRWETGRAHPSASTVLSAMDRLGFDVRGSLSAFYGGDCPWLDRIDPTSREGAAHLLDDLRGELRDDGHSASRSAGSTFPVHRELREEP